MADLTKASENSGGCNSTYEAQYTRAVDGFAKFGVGPSDPRLENFKKFKPRPSDVLVVSPGKCGSTWMQQIVHGVRTRGDMEFKSINAMVPMLETALDGGYDIHGEQLYSPRCFKTHRAWEDRPKGHKYIFVIRDPKDALVSQYEFYRGWIIPEDLPLDIFAKVFVLEQRESLFSSVYDAIASWWPYRNDPGTLWVHYEDLKADLPSAVHLIVKFMGFDTQDTELLDIVIKQASFEFMKANEDKFRTEHRGFNPNMDKGPSKVNKGVSNRKSLLPEATQLSLDEHWKKIVEPVTGFPTYAEMRDHLTRELGRPWAVQK